MPGYRIIKTFTYCLIFLLFFASCKENKNLIPEDKFVDVLVDLHIADAIALNNIPRYSGFELDSAELYGAVFDEYGITLAMFDSTISYYGSHPDAFLEVYDKVTAKLKMLNDELMNEPSQDEGSVASELVWQDNRVYAFPEMGTNRVEINVPVQVVGEYTVSATIKLYKDDESRNPGMSLYFWYDNQTPDGYRDPFPEVSLKKSEEQISYVTTKVLSDSRVTHIRGYVLDYSNRNNDFKQHALVSDVSVILKAPQ